MPEKAVQTIIAGLTHILAGLTKVCQIPGSSFHQRGLQDSLILPEGLAKLWNVWWDPSPTAQNLVCWCLYVLFMGPALAEDPCEHPWLMS